MLTPILFVQAKTFILLVMLKQRSNDTKVGFLLFTIRHFHYVLLHYVMHLNVHGVPFFSNIKREVDTETIMCYYGLCMSLLYFQ